DCVNDEAYLESRRRKERNGSKGLSNSLAAFGSARAFNIGRVCTGVRSCWCATARELLQDPCDSRWVLNDIDRFEGNVPRFWPSDLAAPRSMRDDNRSRLESQQKFFEIRGIQRGLAKDGFDASVWKPVLRLRIAGD